MERENKLAHEKLFCTKQCELRKSNACYSERLLRASVCCFAAVSQSKAQATSTTKRGREREIEVEREREKEGGREASSTSIKSKPVREGQKRSNVGIRFLATLKLVSNSLLRVVLNTLQFS